MVASEKVLSDSIFSITNNAMDFKGHTRQLRKQFSFKSKNYLFWLGSWKGYPCYEMPLFFFKKPCPELWEAESIWLAE